ncbi:MAG: glutamate-5-semialdehyde dehydrogenase [Clostridia bacterium]|nr:glutamate-5-semialdehyde dehydrogenase [Clostridia bacterium]
MEAFIGIEQMGQNAKTASRKLRMLETVQKNKLLGVMAETLEKHKSAILAANQMDLDAASKMGLKEALLERLELNEKKFVDMVIGLRQVMELKDPVGEIDSMHINQDGLEIGSKRVPLGVIGIIYESRPNVTIDAAALCLKTGNAVILKGGSDALLTNQAIMASVKEALSDQNLPEGCVQLVESTDRSLVKDLLEATNYVDCIIPRGGAGLIKFVVDNAKVPIIETGAGNCHIYVDDDYEIGGALDIITNAKVQRPGACNAVETVLVHRGIAETFVPQLVKHMTEQKVSLFLCQNALELLDEIPASVLLATEEDWRTEYLDFKLAVRIVYSLDEALDHIDEYSTGHSEAILTHNYENARKFLSAVDSSAVYVNASTRFTDGSQFGFGAEIGISTQKLHARGPMGLRALTSSKYVIYGNGQIRK